MVLRICTLLCTTRFCEGLAVDGMRCELQGRACAAEMDDPYPSSARGRLALRALGRSKRRNRRAAPAGGVPLAPCESRVAATEDTSFALRCGNWRIHRCLRVLGKARHSYSAGGSVKGGGGRCAFVRTRTRVRMSVRARVRPRARFRRAFGCFVRA
eukprot:717208-Pleurochrysis_carterae.AAC.4